jgi:hypothetical protein
VDAYAERREVYLPPALEPSAPPLLSSRGDPYGSSSGGRGDPYGGGGRAERPVLDAYGMPPMGPPPASARADPYGSAPSHLQHHAVAPLAPPPRRADPYDDGWPPPARADPYAAALAAAPQGYDRRDAPAAAAYAHRAPAAHEAAPPPARSAPPAAGGGYYARDDPYYGAAPAAALDERYGRAPAPAPGDGYYAQRSAAPPAAPAGYAARPDPYGAAPAARGGYVDPYDEELARGPPSGACGSAGCTRVPSCAERACVSRVCACVCVCTCSRAPVFLLCRRAWIRAH